MKRYLILLAFITAISCTSANQERDKVNLFITEWAQALTAGDKSVAKFYTSKFIIPEILFNIPEGLSFKVDIDQLQFTDAESNDEIIVTVPFSINDTHVTGVERGNFILTILKTEKGYLINEMTKELFISLKEHSIRFQTENNPTDLTIRYDSILKHVNESIKFLNQSYDSVVFFTEANDEILFYVVKGNWEYPFYYDKQRDDGDYLMGVVTAENKVIIPVSYSKIYNPHGTIYEMIEVEKDGLRGLYTVDGKNFIPAEFDGIYPSDVNNTVAQVRKGDTYGWVDTEGKVYFDATSHTNKQLFQSPLESKTILNWEFTYPGAISLLINPYNDISESNGIIIYPSYVRDLGITTIANAYVMLETSSYSMGMTDTTIKFEKVESLSDKLYSLVSFFMETGADARGYHTAQNDLLVVDEQFNKLNHLEKLTEEYGAQNPCGEVSPIYQAIEDNVYESADGYGNYKYYKITADGEIEALETVRKYNFTKFTKINESYFNHCRYESLDFSNWEDQTPNVVVISGLSSEELDIMRNEIFAEYGLIFKSEKWRKYFEAQAWYEGKYDNVDQYLSETDKFNIKFILDYQKEHKEQVEQRDSIQFMWAG